MPEFFAGSGVTQKFTYVKLNDAKFCENTEYEDAKYGEYHTLPAAQTACDVDDNCKYVYNENCNGGTYNLCPAYRLQESSTGSCVYQKKGIFYIGSYC